MIPESLGDEVRRAQGEYGKALIIAFQFPTGSLVDASALARILIEGRESSVRAYLEYLRKETDELQTMKFVGER